MKYLFLLNRGAEEDLPAFGTPEAVAMAEGPAAGLVILDALGGHPQLSRWPQLHMARADLLRRLAGPAN